ncbi:MAG: hypothetical protein EB127_25560, partial [Alphaproteobacteria bacterium]|nr:hypothetical protein [Alphaproteobacteria bacterium]
LAGLDQLSSIPIVIYGIQAEVCRGSYDRYPTMTWKIDEIAQDFFNDEEAVGYFAQYTDDLPEYNFDAFIDKIKTGEVVTIAGEEAAYLFCRDKETLEKHLDDWEAENGYNNEDV